MYIKNIDESEYLRKQYKNQDNLQVRIQTHEKYTHPKIDFISFILNNVPWTGQETVIDVGCGAGAYVEQTRKRCHKYFVGDLSFGMLQGLPMADLSRVNIDAQQLPFADETADVILANHMLYHVPDQDAAVREIYRVLKPGGYLLAATNSGHNMPELTQLRMSMSQQFGFSIPQPTESRLSFTLENGNKLLERHFDSVIRQDLKNALVFPTAQPVLDYINTSPKYYMGDLLQGIRWETVEAAIRRAVNDHIAKEGTFRIQKLTGVFVCRKD